MRSAFVFGRYQVVLFLVFVVGQFDYFKEFAMNLRSNESVSRFMLLFFLTDASDKVQQLNVSGMVWLRVNENIRNERQHFFLDKLLHIFYLCVAVATHTNCQQSKDRIEVVVVAELLLLLPLLLYLLLQLAQCLGKARLKQIEQHGSLT